MKLGKIIIVAVVTFAALSCGNNGRNGNNGQAPASADASGTASMALTPVPSVNLVSPDGSPVDLATLIDRTTYIDIWASWCGPCRGEIPHMAELVNHFKDNDKVRFISISVDESREDWAACLADENPSWPQYIAADREGLEKLADALQIEYIPRFILTDAEGNIIENNAPRPSSGEEIIALIEKEL